MVERTTFQDILTCVIAVIIFILQSLHHLMTWINQFIKYRRNTVFAVTTNTTKPSVDNALENFIRVQQSIQKHFDIPLIDAEEESKVDESIQNTQCSTSSNNSEEKDEFVNRQVDDSYVARGFGLIAATAGRQSEFYLYSKYGYNFENIIVELKGRNFETGRATIFNQNHSSPEKSKSIPIDYAYDDDRIKVTYIPYTEGVHTLTLLRNGVHICRSPYYISVEKSPTNSRSRIRLGTKKSKMITKFGRGKCASTEMKYTPVVECFESFTKVDEQPLTKADNYKGMDVMSIVTKFESKSAGKKIPKRTSNVTEKSPERDLSDNGIVDSDEQPETNVSNDNGDQNQNNNPEIDLKLKKVNLKYANESNDICEKTADGDRRQNTKSKTIRNETSVKTIYCSDAPQNVSPSISLQDESSYKTEILDQTSVISQQLQKHNDREMVLSTHQSKKINFTDDEIHTKNEIYREKITAVLKENIKEPNQTSNTAQQITDWKQYSISSPLASFITNITNDMCEKCSKQVFIIISELFRDINKKHNTNSNDICSSFKTLLAQPNKNDTNIDDVLENTSREATDQFKSACSKINDAIHLEPENADEDTNLKHESTDKIKALCNNNKSSINDADNKTNFELMNEQKKDNNEINRALTQNVANNSFVVVTNCNVEIAEHQKNELPLNKLELQKAVSEIVMPNNALCVDNIKNSDNKLESHDSKTQTNSAHDNDLIKSNYCEEKYLYEDSDLVLETDDSSIERNKHVIKGTHIQQTDSEIQNCTLSSPTTNAQLEKIKITKLEQTIDVCDVNNSYLNKKQAIEKFIEPVLNSFKNKMVERIVQLLTVKENSLNTNVRQHLDNYNTNKNAERPKQQNLSNTENNAIENNKTLIKQEKDHITKNEVSDIISNKDQTNNDLFEHIKTYFKIYKNTHEINAEEVSKKFCTAVLNTKMHRLNDNRLNVVYDINCDQKRKNDTCKQEIQLVTSTLNNAKIMLENESKNDQLEKLNTEVISTKQLQSCILKDRNALLQEVTINFETKTTDDQNFQQTETIIPLSDNYKSNDLKNKNTTEHETTFFNQPLNEPESKVIKKSAKRIMEPLSSSSHENHNSNTSVLQPETTSETKLLDFPTKVNTEKLCSTTIGTTTEKSPNKINSDGVEKLSTVDTEILPEESTKTKNFQNEITQETIEDINATETETMKVKNAMSNESEFKTVVETLISADNAISVEPIEIENNKRSKTLSELNKVDCTSLQIVDKKTEFQLPSLINVNNITVKNKTKSNEMQSIIDSLCSNCTAIVTIKTDTQSNILSPITTLTIEVQEPNTVVIENLSNIEIKNITKNYKANLKRETEIKHVEETPLTAKSTILLSNTINTNELNNIETLLKVVDTNVLTEIQKSNEINVVEIDKDQTNKIDESAENSVIVIESKNKIENTSDIFIANTPLFSVEELKSEKNIYADKKTSKLDHTLITTMEQSKKSETITTPVIEESDNIETTFCKENQVFSDTCVPYILLDTQSKKVLTENTSIFLEANNINGESSDKLENTFIKLSPKLNKYETENTSKNHIPAVDISYESIHTSIELECEPIVLDSSSSTTQAILMDENKLKMKSETIVSTDNATTQLNKLNKEMLQITPITPVTSNTLVGAIKTRNKLKSKTTHNTLVTNNMSATFTDMKELQIIPEAMVSNQTLITPQKTFNKEKIQTTSKLLKDDHIDGIDKSKPFTTKHSKKMSWSDDSSIPNQELSENYEIHTLLKNLEPKYVPIKSLETPNAIVNFKDNLSEIQVSKNISEVLVKKSVKTNGKTKIKSLISHDTYDGVKKQTKEEEECICKNNKEIIHQMNIENISPMEKETEVSEKKLLNKTETLPTGEILKTAVKFTNTENISLVEEISDKYEKQFLNSKETLTNENKLKTTIEITNSENICPVEKKANISEEEHLNITKTLTTKEVLETTIEITNSKNIRTVKKKSEITEDNLLNIIENISDPVVEIEISENISPVEEDTEKDGGPLLNIKDTVRNEEKLQNIIETTNSKDICLPVKETKSTKEQFLSIEETLQKEEYLTTTIEIIKYTDTMNPVEMKSEISEKNLMNNTATLPAEEILKTNIEIIKAECISAVEKEIEIYENPVLNILNNHPSENNLVTTTEITNRRKICSIKEKIEKSETPILNTTETFQAKDLLENNIKITNTEDSSMVENKTKLTEDNLLNIIKQNYSYSTIEIENTESRCPVDRETQISENPLLNNMETLPTEEIAKTSVEFANTETIIPVEKETEIFEKQILNIEDNFPMEKIFEKTIETTNTGKICSIEEETEISEENFFNTTETLETDKILENLIKITNPEDTNTVKEKSKISEKKCFNITKHLPREEHLLSTGETINTDEINPIKMRTEISEKKLLNNTESLLTEEILKTNIEITQTENKVEKETEISEEQRLNILDNLPNENILEATIETTNTEKLGPVEKKPEISKAAFLNTTKPFQIEDLIENAINITNTENSKQTEITKEPFFNIIETLPIEKNLETDIQISNTERITPVEKETEIPEKHLLNITETIPAGVILETPIKYTNTENISPVENKTKISEDRLINMTKTSTAVEVLDTTIKITNFENIRKVENEIEITEGNCLHVKEIISTENISDSIIEIKNSENISPVNKDTRKNEGQLLNIKDTVGNEEKLQNIIETTNSEDVCPHKKETKTIKEQLINISKTLPREEDLITTIDIINIDKINSVEMNTEISEETLLNKTETLLTEEISKTNIKTTVDKETEISEKQLINILDYLPTENISEATIEKINTGKICPVEENNEISEDNLFDNINQNISDSDTTIKIKNTEIRCPYETKISKKQLLYDMETLSTEEIAKTSIKIANTGIIIPVEKHTEAFEESILNITNTAITTGDILKTAIEITNAENLNPVDKETEISEKQLINILDNLPMENISETTIEKTITGKICPVEQNKEVSGDNLFNIINQNISDSDTTIEIKNTEIRCPYNRETKISEKQLLYDMETLPTEEIAKTSIEIANTGIIIPVEKHTKASEESILNITNRAITTGDILETTIEITNAENLSPVDKETEISEKQLINILDNYPTENILEKTFKLTNTGKICPVKEKTEISADYNRFIMETLPTDEITKTSIKNTETTVEKHTESSEESLSNILETHSSEEILETSNKITNTESTVDREIKIPGKLLLNDTKTFPSEDMLDTTIEITNTEKVSLDEKKTEISQEPLKISTETIPTEAGTFIEITTSENINPVENQTNVSGKILSNVMETLPTKRTSEPLPEEDENFNFYECVEFVRPMTVNVETLSDLIDKSNNNETDHKIYDSKITKKKNTVAGELKYYMKIDNTYDSLISKTTPQNKIYEDFDELNELEKKQLTVDGAEIKIADSNKSMESVCEHQNITLNSNSSIEDNNENTLEARFESNDTETEFYGELDHPTITVFKKNNFGDDNEKIDDQKIIINRGESSQECSCSAAANDNADDENVYGVQKLEMSLQCTKTSNDDYFEKTFVKLQKTEKISIDQNQSDDDSTTLPDEKSYIVNESDLNAILCASSLEEALTLLDSKINLRFKNRNKTRKPSGIIDSTMYKQSLQSRYTSSNNSEKNANFAEAQEFFKNIEKN